MKHHIPIYAFFIKLSDTNTSTKSRITIWYTNLQNCVGPC